MILNMDKFSKVLQLINKITLLKKTIKINKIINTLVLLRDPRQILIQLNDKLNDEMSFIFRTVKQRMIFESSIKEIQHCKI